MTSSHLLGRPYWNAVDLGIGGGGDCGDCVLKKKKSLSGGGDGALAVAGVVGLHCPVGVVVEGGCCGRC